MWMRKLTPLGEVLRYTRIDALPQLVNVLRGEMSLLGDGHLPFFLD
jgi:lipopolysaccharide/colanic/teichoic acid biosynthesis glycosyltransferase